MDLFADAEGPGTGWIVAGGVALVAILKEIGVQMGLLSTRKQAAVNEVVKGMGDLIKILQADQDEQGQEIKELKAENRECGRRTALLEREVIRMGGNPDNIDGNAGTSGVHRIAPEGADL